MPLPVIMHARENPARTVKTAHPVNPMIKLVVKFVQRLIIFETAELASLSDCAEPPVSAIFPLLASVRILSAARLILRDDYF